LSLGPLGEFKGKLNEALTNARMVPDGEFLEAGK